MANQNLTGMIREVVKYFEKHGYEVYVIPSVDEPLVYLVWITEKQEKQKPYRRLDETHDFFISQKSLERMPLEEVVKRIEEAINKSKELRENLPENLEELLKYWKGRYPRYQIDVLPLRDSYAIRFGINPQVWIEIPKWNIYLPVEELIKKYTPNLD
ncbi:MAG: hypothetical protein QXW65_02355 [Candidatus Pacearchaeota archaeon]